MADRLDAKAPVAETGQASRRAPDSGPQTEPDEATRARFEQELREVDRRGDPQEFRQDGDAVTVDTTRPGEASAIVPSYACMATCSPMPPSMSMPVPASIPGQAPASSSAPRALHPDAGHERPPQLAMIPVAVTRASEDIRLEITARFQGEGQAVGGALPAPRGGDRFQAGMADLKAASTPDASPLADDQPASRQASEVPLAGGGGLPGTAPLLSGATTQAQAAAEPRMLPAQVIEDTVARLMVGVDRDGAHQVRVELRHELMPGVRMVLQEAGGRVQIDLICAVEASRSRLSAISSREIGDIARRCKRDLLVRVQSEESADAEDSPDCHVVLGVA